ncbi:MAG: HNH endonuclease [Actinobacteria bacterium]|nr:HNH endonuclease [Actinomycetota bacterium]
MKAMPPTTNIADGETPTFADVPLERLESEITELSAHLNAAECRWLLLVAEFDRRQGWGTWECRSCAHWLNWKCGIDVATARQKVRVAHCLRQLPMTTAAFAAGKLSYSKVRALTRVATPDNEGDLLELALTGTASHLERIVRAYRGALRDDEVDTANDLHDRRSVQWHHDDDGSFVLSARLTPEQGALVRQALEAATEAVDNGSAEPLSTGQESRGQRRADALAIMAESFLATGEHAGHSGDRHLVAVHVDAEVLASDTEGRCELEDGPALAAETARRLGCDAAVVAVVEDGRGTPLDVGRKTRSIPPAVRRALQVRDGGCRFPGCTNRRFVDGHHIRHWAAGGETSLANLVLLCRRHHRAVHEGGYTAEATADPHDPVRFLRPDGTLLGEQSELPATDHRAVVDHNCELGLDIDHVTAVPTWAGERLDLGLCVDGLLAASPKESRRE